MTFTDDQINELIVEARQATFCRCCHESQEQECGIHGDAHFRLVGGLADALVQVKVARMMEFATAQAENAALRDDIGNLEVERDTLRRDRFLMGQEETKALYERDALRAVIEEALRVPDAVSIDSRTWRNVAEEQRRILSRTLDAEKGDAS